METAHPVVPCMPHGIAHEFLDRLREEQAEARAATLAFFAEKHVGSTSSTTDREIPGADLPARESLRDLHSHRFSLSLRKTRGFAIRGVDHVATADCHLANVRATGRHGAITALRPSLNKENSLPQPFN